MTIYARLQRMTLQEMAAALCNCSECCRCIAYDKCTVTDGFYKWLLSDEKELKTPKAIYSEKMQELDDLEHKAKQNRHAQQQVSEYREKIKNRLEEIYTELLSD